MNEQVLALIAERQMMFLIARQRPHLSEKEAELLIREARETPAYVAYTKGAEPKFAAKDAVAYVFDTELGRLTAAKREDPKPEGLTDEQLATMTPEQRMTWARTHARKS